MPRSSKAWVSSSSLDSVFTALRQTERPYQVQPISSRSSWALKSMYVVQPTALPEARPITAKGT